MAMEGAGDTGRRRPAVSLDRHSESYRVEFERLTDELHSGCPVAWNETHGGYWYAAGHQELFDLARRGELLSNDNDVTGAREGYVGISIPHQPTGRRMRGGFLEMDPPDQRYYRQALNPYLSPAAVARWVPVVEELTRACLDEVIETGRIDFVDDLANIVPAVLTMALLGAPLKDWDIYCEPIHAVVYTPPDAAGFARVRELLMAMGTHMLRTIGDIRENPRPGLIDELLRLDLGGGRRPDDMELLGVLNLLIGGGFDTTTALTAHSLEWLAANPGERERLSRERGSLLDSATEEFLRFFTPAQGDGRTIAQDCVLNGIEFREGERLWLSWAMANRDAAVFDDPHRILLDREGNRHNSFGLGIHRCIGSNVARSVFKIMLTAVLDRMPDFACVAGGAVHYDTIGVINGMKHLPATFTPGPRLGAGLEETIARLQVVCDDQRLAEPVTVRKARARLD